MRTHFLHLSQNICNRCKIINSLLGTGFLMIGPHGMQAVQDRSSQKFTILSRSIHQADQLYVVSVDLYVYTPDIANTNTRLSSDTFDWSMSEVLSSMLASLRKRGWKIAKEPLLGIGQVFGGPMAQTHSHWLIP